MEEIRIDVKKQTPAEMEMVAGNPARIIRKI